MDNIRNNLYRNLGRDLVCCENERIKSVNLTPAHSCHNLDMESLVVWGCRFQAPCFGEIVRGQP